MRRQSCFFIAVLVTAGVAAQVTHPPQVKTGDLKGNMQLLNLWGEQSGPVQQAYEAAYKILAARPEASFADLGKHAKVQRLFAEAGITHFGGPMLGCVKPDGVSVWLRTLRPARVEVCVTVEESELRFGPVESTEASDLAAVVQVSGLQPGQRYPYRVLVDGAPILATPGTLVTAPADAQSRTRIAFGSCYHRWGLGNRFQAETLCAHAPDALLLIGDIAVQDRENHLGLHRADYLLRDFMPAWQETAASIPIYATWDDHDYFKNDGWGIPKGFTEQDRQGVWDVFRHAWNNPSWGFNAEGHGVFLRTRVGCCDILMVDHRYFRTAPEEGRSGNLLGPDQMQWLETQLLDCKGPFIILSSGTMWSDYVSDGKDSWGVYDPEARERIFSLIEKHQIPGVLLISGDRHGARVFTLPRPSGYQFYEFEPASLGGRGDGPPATDPEWTNQLFGIIGEYAFGEFTLDATVSDPEAVFRLVRYDNTTLYELRLTRSQLTPPSP
ncbi:MAG: alkaline phosphatase D family protein [Candidatus Hydrogenedentes bacterium]|nr:alkaline phosphatase D family protein [Candidatus Hydrogenedentota bacterium]